jgi:hypothetical protein
MMYVTTNHANKFLTADTELDAYKTARQSTTVFSTVIADASSLINPKQTTVDIKLNNNDFIFIRNRLL